MAGLARNVLYQAVKQTSLLRCCGQVNITVFRGAKFKRWVRPRLQELYNRRLEQGPDPEKHRSESSNWNYDAEIFAFGKRLGEEFNEETLRMAFTEKSYIEKEKRRQKELGIESDTDILPMPHNEELAQLGEETCAEYIKSYLRYVLPSLPGEGICAITEYLMSEEMLHYIASNLGLTDIILCEDFPVLPSTLSHTFKAVIGTLTTDQGKHRAGQFVQDFILTQVIGKTLSELWNIKDPMGTLTVILQEENQALPEPRLLWQTGCETAMAVYMIGVYTNKQMIGKGYGETVTIAEEMAARDALNRMFGLTLDRKPFPFGKEGREINLDGAKSNIALKDLTA